MSLERSEIFKIDASEVLSSEESNIKIKDLVLKLSSQGRVDDLLMYKERCSSLYIDDESDDIEKRREYEELVYTLSNSCWELLSKYEKWFKELSHMLNGLDFDEILSEIFNQIKKFRNFSCGVRYDGSIFVNLISSIEEKLDIKFTDLEKCSPRLRIWTKYADCDLVDYLIRFRGYTPYYEMPSEFKLIYDRLVYEFSDMNLTYVVLSNTTDYVLYNGFRSDSFIFIIDTDFSSYVKVKCKSWSNDRTIHETIKDCLVEFNTDRIDYEIM